MNEDALNWQMLGHEWAVRLLREHLAQGRTRQAYLITGPEGVGRRTLALRLAQALNCPQPLAPGVPCGACRSCTQIANMVHPDLTVVQAEKAGGTLKVDQVRSLQRSLALSPYEGRYRVGVLLRFEEAHPSAENALLKTLEEPPPKVVLIVTALDQERLLPTTVSRCEILRLRLLPFETISAGLRERWGAPVEAAQRLAHLSGGRPGYALRLFQEPEVLQQREAWLDDLEGLLGAGRVERFAYAERAARDKEQLRGLLQVWTAFWRDVLIRASGAGAPLVHLEREEQVDGLARCCGLAGARQTIESLEETLALLDHNANTRLAFEVLMLKLPRT